MPQIYTHYSLSFFVCPTPNTLPVSGSDGAAGEAGPNHSQAQEAAEGLLQEDWRDGR